MSHGEGKHVFVSYVREDNTEVDKLCKVLEAAKIPYWRIRTSLGPGDTTPTCSATAMHLKPCRW